MQKLALANLDRFFEAVAARQALYLPVEDAGGQASFQRWAPGAKLSGALNTTRSAKDFFFPQTEDLVNFKVRGKEIEISTANSKVRVYIIPTNEELMIARDTKAIAGK